jgi:hypothetical protein
MDGFPLTSIILSLTITAAIGSVAVRHSLAMDADLVDLA